MLGPPLSGLQPPWSSDVQPHHSSFSLYLHMASPSLCVFISGFFSENTHYSLYLIKCDLFLASYISKSLVSLPHKKKPHMRFWINIGFGGNINQLIEAFLLGLSYPKAKPNNFINIHAYKHMSQHTEPVYVHS